MQDLDENTSQSDSDPIQKERVNDVCKIKKYVDDLPDTFDPNLSVVENSNDEHFI